MYLDLNDVEGVKDMGIHSWIQEKIELSQFVVILCSTGARFKCAKNRQFKMKQEREVWVLDLGSDQNLFWQMSFSSIEKLNKRMKP